VNTHRNAARAGGHVVSRKSSLPALVQLAIVVQGQRMRWNYKTGPKFLAQRH
jgi:hypothetical protein